MTDSYLHISFLVKNLKEGMAEYGRLFGIAFRPPQCSPLADLEQFGIEETGTELRAAYSVAGPPYYELIEATGCGMFDPAQGFGFHHVGLWMEDPDELRAQLALQNIPVEGIYWSPEGDIFTIHTAPAGENKIRFEYLNRKFEKTFAEILETGVVPQ